MNIKTKKTEDFTQILQDKELSLKSKSLFAILLFTADTTSRQSDIKEFCSDGLGSIRTAYQELQDKGYLNLVNCGGGKYSIELTNGQAYKGELL